MGEWESDKAQENEIKRREKGDKRWPLAKQDHAYLMTHGVPLINNITVKLSRFVPNFLTLN